MTAPDLSRLVGELLTWLSTRASIGADDECWPWLLARMPRGYGVTSTPGNRRRNTLAHRRVWEALNGKIPRGMYVCHRCDNPPCVNPEHLFLGTAADNTEDMVSKGRHVTKLTESQVREIRAAHASGEARRALARRFGVNKNLIRLIVTRQKWARVA